MNPYKEHKQCMWKLDIDAYGRWKAMYDKYGAEFAKEQMETIKQRWPHHAKAFE